MRTQLVKVNIIHASDGWPYQRQTPGESLQWDGVQFYLNDHSEDAFDYIVVLEDLPNDSVVCVGEGRKMLYTFEPMIVKKYPKAFLQQFDVIVTNCTDIRGDHVVHTQTSLPWMVGCIFDPKTRKWLPSYSKNYDELKKMRISDKRDKISMIISNKNFTTGHKKRLQFAGALREHFKEKIDLFGVGFRPIPDKWDALYPYKYAVVLENSVQENYWSEKLSDAFLSFCFPFYVGCPNVLDYFPHQSLVTLSIRDVDSSIQTIERALCNDMYSKNFEYIAQSRSLILDKYQLFPAVVQQIEKRNWPETPYAKTVLRSQKSTQTLSERIINKLKWNTFNRYLPIS